MQHIKQDTSRKAWMGYASGFERICHYLDSIASRPLEPGFQSIIAISEHLSEQTRQRMGYYFKTPVVSRYYNMENGIIAQQPLDTSAYYVINRASYHVEILNMDNDNPSQMGTLGRMVVTDFFNYATPLIRYDTGDVGVMELVDGIMVLKRIEGRASERIFSTHGDVVSSFVIIDACNFKGIHQIQLVQQSQDHYTLKLNTSNSFANQSELIANFKSYLGNDAQIDIVYVKEIPLLRSGKRKITVNNYKV